MTSSDIFDQIVEKQSFLCIGLDSDIQKLPKHILRTDDPIFNFNKEIIDATHEVAVAYKPNLAFYESQGVEGWRSLEKTVDYIRKKHPNIFIIADAKRGDIGNTSTLYARAFFENMDFDAVTVAPYMGEDSVKPFLNYESKWIILLALTSNKGASDFQFIEDEKTGARLFENVLATSKKWGNNENMMYVVGATKAEMLKEVRAHVPHHFLLVPGIGAQGGSLRDVVENGMNERCGLLVNASRSIIFADETEDFASEARKSAKALQKEMAVLLKEYNLVK